MNLPEVLGTGLGSSVPAVPLSPFSYMILCTFYMEGIKEVERGHVRSEFLDKMEDQKRGEIPETEETEVA